MTWNLYFTVFSLYLFYRRFTCFHSFETSKNFSSVCGTDNTEVLQMCTAGEKENIKRYVFLETTKAANITKTCLCEIRLQDTKKRATVEFRFRVKGSTKIKNISEVFETDGRSLDGSKILFTKCHPDKNCRVVLKTNSYHESSTCLLIYTKGLYPFGVFCLPVGETSNKTSSRIPYTTKPTPHTLLSTVRGGDLSKLSGISSMAVVSTAVAAIMAVVVIILCVYIFKNRFKPRQENRGVTRKNRNRKIASENDEDDKESNTYAEIDDVVSVHDMAACDSEESNTRTTSLELNDIYIENIVCRQSDDIFQNQLYLTPLKV